VPDINLFPSAEMADMHLVLGETKRNASMDMCPYRKNS
jgi:hypothetical protein